MLLRSLAPAWRWQKLLDRGVYGSVTEIADAERISKSDVSRILRLALLALDLVNAIIGDWADQRVKLERPLQVAWEEQRHELVDNDSSLPAPVSPAEHRLPEKGGGCRISSAPRLHPDGRANRVRRVDYLDTSQLLRTRV